MTIFDDTPPVLRRWSPSRIPLKNHVPAHQSHLRSTAIRSPMQQAPAGPYNANPALPEDLRISWSWPHLILFLFFAGASFVVVQTALFFYYGPRHPLPKEELERYLLNKPQFIFGTNLLWYAAVFFFLYITLSVLRDSPFWSSLGWKKLKSSPSRTGEDRGLTSSVAAPWPFSLGSQVPRSIPTKTCLSRSFSKTARTPFF